MTAPTSSSTTGESQSVRQARALMLHPTVRSEQRASRPVDGPTVRIRGQAVVTVAKAVYLPSYESPDDDLML
eukprot:14060301-Heterocapsa_arctica.AAC.1